MMPRACVVSGNASHGGLPWVLPRGPTPSRQEVNISRVVVFVTAAHPLWFPLRWRNSHSILRAGEVPSASQARGLRNKNFLEETLSQASHPGPAQAVPYAGSSETALACRSRVHGQTLGPAAPRMIRAGRDLSLPEASRQLGRGTCFQVTMVQTGNAVAAHSGNTNTEPAGQ